MKTEERLTTNGSRLSIVSLLTSASDLFRGCFRLTPSSYQDSAHMRFGPLRVINEDYVESSKGIEAHSHREFEIFSYVIDGEIEQYVLSCSSSSRLIPGGSTDSMGNIKRITREDLLLTSAGTPSAFAPTSSSKTPAHILQIWAVPHTQGLKPACYTRKVTDEEKIGVWAAIVKPVNSRFSKTSSKALSYARDDRGPAPIQSHPSMYATLLDQGVHLARPLEGKKAYLHVVQGGPGARFGKAPEANEAARVRVWTSPREGSIGWFGCEQIELGEGDGCYVWVGDTGNNLDIENVGTSGKRAEVVLFDME